MSTLPPDIVDAGAARRYRRAGDRQARAAWRSGRRHSEVLFGLLGTGVATAFLVIFTGIFVVRDAAYGINGLTNEQLRFLAFPLAGLGAILIAANIARATRLALSNILLLVLIGYAALSTFWSVDPSMTGTRSIALVLSAIAAIGLVCAFRPANLMKIVAMAMTVGSALSVILWKMGDPLVHDTQAWLGVRGVFSHKNLLGQCALIGAILSAGLIVTRSAFDRLLGIAMFVTAMAAIYIANSATAVVASGIGLALLGLLFLTGQRWMPLVARPVIVASAALVAGLGYLFRDKLVEMLGREPTLTGRDEIWDYVMFHIAQAPIAGHGFRAFFTSQENAANVRTSLDHAYDQAHSSILQTLLDLGVIGIVILGLWILVAATRIPGAVFDPARRVWLVLAIALLVNSMTEALIMSPTGFAWLTLQIAILSLFAVPAAPTGAPGNGDQARSRPNQ